MISDVFCARHFSKHRYVQEKERKEGEKIMDNCNNVFTTDLTPANQAECLHPSTEETSEMEENIQYKKFERPFRRKGIPLYAVVIVILSVMLITSIIQIYQYKQYSNIVEQKAYMLSVTINLLEDNLMMKYGAFPQEIGFEKLRSAWIDNPCYETALAYYEALSSFFEYYDNYLEPAQELEIIRV